jgi:hypothetical protein
MEPAVSRLLVVDDGFMSRIDQTDRGCDRAAENQRPSRVEL